MNQTVLALLAKKVATDDEEETNNDMKDHRLLTNQESSERAFLVLKDVLGSEASNKDSKNADEINYQDDLTIVKQVV